MKKSLNLDIPFGTKCNLNCDMCCFNDIINKKEKANYDNIKNYLMNNEVDEIYIGGAESLLTEYKYIHKLMVLFPNISWKITTNLAYKFTNYEQLYILRNCRSVTTSFDVGGVRFHRVSQLVRWYHNLRFILKYIRKDIDINICITSKLIKIPPKRLSKFFHKLGVESYKYTPMSEFGSLKNNKYLIPDKEKYVQWMLKVLELNDLLDHTLSSILNGMYYSCVFMYLIQPFNQEGRPVKCQFLNDKCEKDLNCLYCDYYGICGGKCSHTQCYFDIRIYAKAKELEESKYYDKK